jgi:hypothetical protein
MYVKTSTVPRGSPTYRYLPLVEAYRERGKVRHELVCRLGEAEELRSSGQLDRIIAALRRHAEGHWLEAGELVASPDAPSFGDITVVASYFSRLLLDRHFARLGDGRRPKGLVWRRGGTVSEDRTSSRPELDDFAGGIGPRVFLRDLVLATVGEDDDRDSGGERIA